MIPSHGERYENKLASTIAPCLSLPKHLSLCKYPRTSYDCPTAAPMEIDRNDLIEPQHRQRQSQRPTSPRLGQSETQRSSTLDDDYAVSMGAAVSDATPPLLSIAARLETVANTALDSPDDEGDRSTLFRDQSGHQTIPETQTDLLIGCLMSLVPC